LHDCAGGDVYFAARQRNWFHESIAEKRKLIKMTNRHALLFSFLTFSLLTRSATGQTVTTGIPNVAPLSLLPPVGLTMTETLQVNVTNVAAPSSAGGLAPSCDGTIAFYVGGSLVGTVAGFSVGSFTPGSQRVFSASLPYSSSGASGARIIVLAVITPATTAPSSDGTVPPCSLVSSLETFDTSSGVTHVFVPGVAAQTAAGVLRSQNRLSFAAQWSSADSWPKQARHSPCFECSTAMNHGYRRTHESASSVGFQGDL